MYKAWRHDCIRDRTTQARLYLEVYSVSVTGKEKDRSVPSVNKRPGRRRQTRAHKNNLRVQEKVEQDLPVTIRFHEIF